MFLLLFVLLLLFLGLFPCFLKGGGVASDPTPPQPPTPQSGNVINRYFMALGNEDYVGFSDEIV